MYQGRFRGVLRAARINLCIITSLAAACTGAAELDKYVEREPATVMDAPEPEKESRTPAQISRIKHGKYLIELLGCGSCHTNGALIGAPSMDERLAGSRIGIAIDSPIDRPLPAVIFAPNLTPDDRTGLGRWSEEEIGDAIRFGAGRHGKQLRAVMPWAGYTKISEEDTRDIVMYLQSLEPVDHEVPAAVPPGFPSREEFVYFGIYQSR